MLKFLRKYQLILLAIGGSLLMVVFLFEPLINRIGSAASNRTVATMDGGSRKISNIERFRAGAEKQLLQNVVPVLFGDTKRGTNGVINLDDDLDHWMLLRYEAEAAGLVGEAEDGRRWYAEELAPAMAFAQKQFELYQQIPYMPFVNQQMMNPQVQAEVANLAEELRTVFPSRVRQEAARAGLMEDDIYRMLAHARGVSRMIRRHEQAVRQSDRRVVNTVREIFDSAIVDYVVVPASVLSDEAAAPTDEQLRAQFERFRDTPAGQGELGIGYTLPPRVKLGWFSIDASAVAAEVKVDRIEVRKRYTEDRTRYPGEFETERARVESDLKSERVQELMADVDRIVAGQLRAALRETNKVDGYWDIPETWGGVTMESLSEAIVAQIKQQRGVDFPFPGISYMVGQWYTADDIQQMPGFGSAAWQIGPQRIPVSQVTSLARNLGGSRLLLIQERIPVIDPPAVDAAGNRYYMVLFGSKELSPPDSWEEIRDVLVEDYRRLSAYESLVEQMPDLERLAVDEGLEGVAKWFERDSPEDAAEADDDGVKISRWALVSRSGQQPVNPLEPTDVRANNAEFFEAILERASGFDPLTPFGELAGAESVVGFALPSQQAVAIAQIMSFRPATEDRRYALTTENLRSLASRELAEVVGEDREFPFTLEALKKRHDYVLIDGGSSDEE